MNQTENPFKIDIKNIQINTNHPVNDDSVPGDKYEPANHKNLATVLCGYNKNAVNIATITANINFRLLIICFNI